MTTINNIHNTILQKIEEGAIRQKPKWYFVMLTLGVVLGGITLLLILLYLVSFVALVFRERMFFEALSFGPSAVFAIMHTLPLLLLVLVITVFLLLHVLVRYFAFGYMKPVLVTFGSGFALTLFVFVLILVMDKDSRIARIGEYEHIPGARAFHDQFRNRTPLMGVRGTVTKVESDHITVRTATDTDDVTVTVTADTRTDKSTYQVGDQIMVLAEKLEQSLHAVAIRILNEIGTSTPRGR